MIAIALHSWSSGFRTFVGVGRAFPAMAAALQWSGDRSFCALGNERQRSGGMGRIRTQALISQDKGTF